MMELSEEKIRLQKYLAQCGVASRRKAEEMIAEGKVTLNGQTARTGDHVLPGKDVVLLNGKRIAQPSHKVYIMLHKPRGVVTTMKDEMQRKCVAELVSGVKERVFPVGRLDRDSEGLLLLTNDGEFANRLTHPAHNTPKIYRVTVRPGISDEQITALSGGMELDGRLTAPAEVRVLTREENRVVLQIVLREGRNRQIRRMCETLGLEVARLKRTAIGDLKLGLLQVGKWRELTPEEVKKLR